MKFISIAFVMIFSNLAHSNSLDCYSELKNKITEIDVISENIANINTTRTPEGGPFQRKSFVCQESECKIVQHKEFNLKYLPNHYDAEENGYVKFPAIDLEKELKNLIKANKQYESLLTVCK